MTIAELKEKALQDNIPIMQQESLDYIIALIKKHHIKKILEIGTAVGYSAITMASIADDITVTTIERDENRYRQAIENIEKFGLQKRICAIYGDALEVSVTGDYDLILIDAAKGQNIKFFQKFSPYLQNSGYIITDNVAFHGYVDLEIETIESKNIRGIVKKIRKYLEFLEENNEYQTEVLSIGDGLAVCYHTNIVKKNIE